MRHVWKVTNMPVKTLTCRRRTFKRHTDFSMRGESAIYYTTMQHTTKCPMTSLVGLYFQKLKSCWAKQKNGFSIPTPSQVTFKCFSNQFSSKCQVKRQDNIFKMEWSRDVNLVYHLLQSLQQTRSEVLGSRWPGGPSPERDAPLRAGCVCALRERRSWVWESVSLIKTMKIITDTGWQTASPSDILSN